MAQQDNEAEVFAKGLAAAAGLGQLGHIEPDLAYTMIDTVSADQAVMERKFPGLGREELLRAYDDSVRDLVAADALRVGAESRATARRGEVELLAQKTGIDVGRVEALLGGEVYTTADLDDLARLNSI